MSGFQQISTSNRLLRLISEDDFRRISSHLEPVDMPNNFIMAHAGQPLTHVYFVESGIASMVAKSPEGHRVECGLFGRDGCSPPGLDVEIDSIPFDIFMQVGGRGLRIERLKMIEILEASAPIRRLLQRYIHTLAIQAAFTALSNAVHHVDERLARWLLMCHDRVDGNEITLTHEFLSLMLAVRRPSVTTALHALEGNHFIRAERGIITMRNRKQLEAFAADAYGQPEIEYTRLLGSMHASH